MVRLYDILNNFEAQNKDVYIPEAFDLYMLVIKNFLEFTLKNINEITIADIHRWDDYLDRQYTNILTRPFRMAVLSSFFDYCIENQLIEKKQLKLKHAKAS
ncbi:MAG: hypothetical protein ACOYVD_16290 [Bacillota bacterium]